MTQLLVTGLGTTAFLCGLVLLAVWGRRRLQLLRTGAGVDPRCLEVVSRVGLHANQGLAVVRVGRRHLLVSSGEGGARLLTELAEEDLEAPPRERPDFASVLRLHGAQGVLRRMGVAVLFALAAATPTAGLEAQQPFPGDPLQPGMGVPGGNPLDPGSSNRPGAPYPYGVPGGTPYGGLPGQAGPYAPGQAPGASGFGPGGTFSPLVQALPRASLQVGDEEGGFRLDGTVGTVIILGLLSLAPSLLLLSTSFTRIFVVLMLLRQALGTQNTPPGHLLAAMALLLTTAVMAPTFDQIRMTAVQPWMDGQIEDGQMLAQAAEPLRFFMLSQTRPSDLRMFLQISRTPPPIGPDQIPTTVLMSSFVTSELRTAFEIGFAIFLPFIVIDLVVAAVLTSMGMFMLPPTMIALPCKLMLFVLMDGWALLMGTLAQSFL